MFHQSFPVLEFYERFSLSADYPPNAADTRTAVKASSPLIPNFNITVDSGRRLMVYCASVDKMQSRR